MEPREPEPVSPELVLVDPELAPRARAALPERPWWEPVPVRPRRPEPVEPPRPKLVAVEPPAPPERRRRRALTFTVRIPVVGLVLVLLLAAAFAAIELGLFRSDDQRPHLAAARTASAAVPRTTTPATTTTARPANPPGKPKPTTTTRKALTPPPTTTQAQPKPKPAAKPKPKPRAKPKRRVRRGPVPAREYAWRSFAGALFYQATLMRNGRSIYQARTVQPHVRLPASIRFTPGSYRFVVRPGVVGDAGVQYGTPILEKRYQVIA